MRTRISGAEEARIASLLAELRGLEVPPVDVAARLERRLAGLPPGSFSLPSPGQLAAALAAFLGGVGIGLTGLALAVAGTPPGLPGSFAALARAAAGILFSVGTGLLEMLASLGRALLPLLEASSIPTGGGRLTMAATTGFSLALLASLVLLTSIMLWRDLARPLAASSHRRLP